MASSLSSLFFLCSPFPLLFKKIMFSTFSFGEWSQRAVASFCLLPAELWTLPAQITPEPSLAGPCCLPTMFLAMINLINNKYINLVF
jgi:hypothetical protein